MQSREMFSAPGIPETDEAKEKREEEALIYLIELKKLKGKDTRQWQELFKHIDFDLIKKILERVAGRCGIKPEEMNFVASDRVYYSYDWLDSGSYASEVNIIQISGQGAFGEHYVSEQVDTLHALMHEEIHAVSRNTCTGFSDVETEVGSITTSIELQTGLQQGKREAGDYKRSFNALNEGVVEKLARELTLEYMNETGWNSGSVWDPDGKRAFMNLLNSHADEMAYPYPIILVDSLVNKLGEKSGQDKRVIWQALVRALMHGEKFEEEDVALLFAESFGSEFVRDLSELNARSEIDILKFIVKYDLAELSSVDRMKLGL